jgi:hypothetical protein
LHNKLAKKFPQFSDSNNEHDLQHFKPTFLTFSSNFTVMFPVPGPISRTVSVGRKAAYKHNKHGIYEKMKKDLKINRHVLLIVAKQRK